MLNITRKQMKTNIVNKNNRWRYRTQDINVEHGNIYKMHFESKTNDSIQSYNDWAWQHDDKTKDTEWLLIDKNCKMSTLVHMEYMIIWWLTTWLE